MPTRSFPTPRGCGLPRSLQWPAREPTRTGMLRQPPMKDARPARQHRTPRVRTKQVLFHKTVRSSEMAGIAHRNRE